MKEQDKKHTFDKKSLTKLAPAAVVIAAVAVSLPQLQDASADTDVKNETVVKSQDIEGLLKTAYFYEESEEAEETDSKGETKNNKAKSFKKEKGWNKKRNHENIACEISSSLRAGTGNDCNSCNRDTG